MTDKQTPTFQLALGEDWDKLHPAVKMHYNLRPGEALVLTGTMDTVHHSTWVKPLIWIGRQFGALVPYRGKDVPVEVQNSCPADDNPIRFHRTFHFPGRAPYPFRSQMEYWLDNSIVEFVRFGLGIRMDVSVEGDALHYETRGYIWRFGKFHIALPDNLFFGRGEIWEYGVNDNTVDTRFVMTHPIYGKTFEYGGTFTISKSD